MNALEQYDAMVMQVSKMSAEAERRKLEAECLEDAIERKLGLEWHEPKEPGWPGWTHATLDRHYNTPREVLVALEKERNKTSLDSARL